RRDAEIPEGARGMWVWGTAKRLDDAHGTERLLETCRSARLNEVYLSVGNGALEHAGLRDLVVSLRDAGIRVEALMGEADWYLPNRRAAMLAVIDRVGAFNRANPAAFAAIHLDVEPHQIPENRGVHAFLPDLAASLRAARERAATYGMSTSADLPRFAFDEAG